jgi:glutamate N-acetyltransferase/amino-acid N-acetyltransferase
LCVFRGGQPVRTVSLAALSKYMKSKRVTIEVDLSAGRCSDRVLTCDLSREYVAINADYTT